MRVFPRLRQPHQQSNEAYYTLGKLFTPCFVIILWNVTYRKE